MQKQSRQQLKFQALLGERAHFMRHNPAETECTLWRRLSGKKLGVTFRRQVPVGGKYIADFLAPTGVSSWKLMIDRMSSSAWRMRGGATISVVLGYRVLRIDAELVRRNVAEAIALIVAALSVAYLSFHLVELSAQ